MSGQFGSDDGFFQSDYPEGQSAGYDLGGGADYAPQDPQFAQFDYSQSYGYDQSGYGQQQSGYAGPIMTPDPVSPGPAGSGLDNFDDEPPLMEELGVNFDHIVQKTEDVAQPDSLPDDLKVLKTVARKNVITYVLKNIRDLEERDFPDDVLRALVRTAERHHLDTVRTINSVFIQLMNTVEHRLRRSWRVDLKSFNRVQDELTDFLRDIGAGRESITDLQLRFLKIYRKIGELSAFSIQNRLLQDTL